MKKYVKPDLFYENFELSQSVASCNNPLNHSENSCYLDNDDSGMSFLEDGERFFSGGNCNIDPIAGGFEDYCLQTGTDKISFFTS